MKLLRIRDTNQALIVLHIYLIAIMNIVNAVFPVMGFIQYLPDVITLIFLYAIIKRINKRRTISRSLLNSVITPVLLLLLFDILVCVIRQNSLLNLAWGIRNEYRFFVVFIFASFFCSGKNYQHFYNVLDILFIINIPVVIIEYILGYRMDILSGIFGNYVGTNGIYSLFLCCFFVGKTVDVLNKKISNNKYVIYTLAVLLLAAISELKFLIIQVFLVLLIGLMLSKISLKKKLFIVSVAIILALLSVYVLGELYPYYKGFFNIDKVLKYAVGISNHEGGPNRSNFLRWVNNKYFNESISLKMFGLGLGVAEIFPIESMSSSFYLANARFGIDTYFSALLYIQRGFVGLIWYIVFFVIIFLEGIKKRRQCLYEYKYLIDKALILCIVGISQIFYDLSIRRITGFYLYLFISVIFAQGLNKKTN